MIKLYLRSLASNLRQRKNRSGMLEIAGGIILAFVAICGFIIVVSLIMHLVVLPWLERKDTK